MADESSPAAESTPGKQPRKSKGSAADTAPPLHVTHEKVTTTTPESAPEIASWPKIAEADADLDRWKERCILIAVLAALGTSVSVPLAILLFSSQTNLQNWATTAMTTVLSGSFAYFAGRQGRARRPLTQSPRPHCSKTKHGWLADTFFFGASP